MSRTIRLLAALLGAALAACGTNDEPSPSPDRTPQKKGWVYDDGPVFPPIKR